MYGDPFQRKTYVRTKSKIEGSPANAESRCIVENPGKKLSDIPGNTYWSQAPLLLRDGKSI